jgi:hypothetical protein
MSGFVNCWHESAQKILKANIRHCFSQGRWLSLGGLCGRSLTGIESSKPAGAWISVSCECCVLSGRGLCVGLITRPEKPCRVWYVRVWSWSPIMKSPCPTRGCRTKQGWKIFNIYCFNYDHVILGSPKQRSPLPPSCSVGDSNILKLAPVSLLIKREARTLYCSRIT